MKKIIKLLPIFILICLTNGVCSYAQNEGFFDKLKNIFLDNDNKKQKVSNTESPKIDYLYKVDKSYKKYKFPESGCIFSDKLVIKDGFKNIDTKHLIFEGQTSLFANINNSLIHLQSLKIYDFNNGTYKNKKYKINMKKIKDYINDGIQLLDVSISDKSGVKRIKVYGFCFG